MLKKLPVFSIALMITSISTLSFSTLHQLGEESDEMVNVYNEKLQQCGTANMNPGSWDPDYKCTQQYGGVHQLCIENIAETTNKFSLNTGQTDWSSGRGKDNHCVCLGAWSMYVARKNRGEITDGGQKQLKCGAIPRMALTKNYVRMFSKNPSYQGWQKWNGVQLQNQVVDGVNELFLQCSENVSADRLQNLKKNYCQFAKGIKSIEQSQIYMTNCVSKNKESL